MRIACPHCGERGVAEFAYETQAGRVRPGPDGPEADWHAYVYERANPAGVHREMWQHVYGCRRWLVVTRDTRTHAVLGSEDAGG